MIARAVMLSCVVLGLAGCKARAPKLEEECTFTQDCTLTSVGPDCCDDCTPRVGNTASMAAFNAWCASHPAASCKQLDCAPAAVTPECERERCRARSGIHP